MSLENNVKDNLLLELENLTLEERHSVLERNLKELEDEVQLALSNDKKDLAIWKMSSSVIIQEELFEVEEQLNERYYMSR